MNAIYKVSGQFVETSGSAAGPWNAQLQHGAAPAGLIAWVVDQIDSESALADRETDARSMPASASRPFRDPFGGR
jgi:hypothetical protein